MLKAIASIPIRAQKTMSNFTKPSKAITWPRQLKTPYTKAPLLSILLSSALLCACQSTPVAPPPAPTHTIGTTSTPPTQSKTDTHTTTQIDELNTVTVIENTDAINSTDVADKQTATDSYPIDIDPDDDQSISNADTTRQQNNEDLAKTEPNNPLTQTPSEQGEDWSIDESPIATAPPQSTPPVTPSPPSSQPSTPAIIIMAPPEPNREQTKQILLERARQNSQSGTNSAPTLNNGDNLPAFRQLMDIGISQLQANQLSAAESTFTRAQRLAPQSSAVYFYLGQVALKKNQPRKAEAMARRGLIVAQSAERRRALWQVILLAGQKQNNPRVVQEAQNALR